MMSSPLSENVHVNLAPPGLPDNVSVVRGDYQYWHYCCDGCDDRGWGCGYRTLQTLCSWVKFQHHQSQQMRQHQGGDSASAVASATDTHSSESYDISVIASGDADTAAVNCNTANSDFVNTASGSGGAAGSDDPKKDLPDDSGIQVVSSGDQHQNEDMVFPGPASKGDSADQLTTDSQKVRDVPSLLEIQKALVQMGDKAGSFVGSRQWIGSYEVCLCLDFFYDVPCKIIHISQGAELQHHLSALETHFSTLGSPIMMGGDSDAASKGIMGVCTDPPALLVVVRTLKGRPHDTYLDPHYIGNTKTATSLQKSGWVKWILLEDFHQTSFYNLCLPQLAANLTL